ncbi:MAG: ABC transporter permease, partial [Bacteroides sp.]|nr:ABC transporter permease [Bacteroides sp.]
MKTLQYAVRFLVRSRSYSLINLFGLAFSLACCIILLRYIHRELTVDTHCVDREKVIIPLRNINNNLSFSNTSFCDTAYIPESKIVGRFYIDMNDEEPFRYNEQPYTLNTIFGDNHFLELFRFKALEGTLDLSAPDCAILSQACAQRMFGNESAIGKVLVYNDKKSVTVRGVIKQPLCKTSLNFDILLFNEGESGNIEFLQVLPSVDLEAVNKVSNVLRRFKLQNGNYSPLLQSFEFVSLKDLYFKRPSNLTSTFRAFLTFGSTDYLGILFIVAVLLLFVGVMNFINLYMVYMMKRKKEYGIKKVYGLQRGPLFLQIWLENFLLAFWALMVAWLIIEITQVPVSQLMGVKMGYTPFDLYLSLGFLLLLPLLTSVYPYLRHQYMAPITSMRAIANSRQSVATRM